MTQPLTIQALIDRHSQRKFAAYMYWMGWSCNSIAQFMDAKEPTVYSWKLRDNWDDMPVYQRIMHATETRLLQLIMKDGKSSGDYKEIDTLTNCLTKTVIADIKTGNFAISGKDSDVNEKRKAGVEKRSQNIKDRKNLITNDMVTNLCTMYKEGLFDYQRKWHEAGLLHRTRNLLKSRQIGATYFFAREALIDAITTGRDQIFLSASKAQAHVFKHYICQFVAETVGVDLKGDPIILNLEDGRQVSLRFLGTNSKTAQSYHGCLYVDEYFWINKFTELRKVASGMAMHKKWRLTYFSTPSSIAHDAHPFWSGELWNKSRKPADRQDIQVDWASVKDGKLCADGQWRQMVTVQDAVAGGCDLFDIEQLRIEYSEDEFSNLLMCEFMDDTNAVFPFTELQKCLVDSWDVWTDFKPFHERPLANAPVWIGYDPAVNGDAASIVVVAPPTAAGAKFRLIEKRSFMSADFAEQAGFIRKLTAKYNVDYIGIDATGVGHGVYQLVKQFYPTATALQYTADLKGRMVVKAQDIIRRGRLEIDAGDKDIVHALMGIRRSMTSGGGQVTYTSGRNTKGHADLAWALLHVFIHEPFEAGDSSAPTRRTTVEIF